MNSQVRRLAVLLLSIAFALSPLLSRGFGGFNPESFPVQVERWPMQPVGWAFSIWGVIYLSLILASGWAFVRPAEMPGWDRGAWPLGISLAVGIPWIEVARSAPAVSTAMIFSMAAGAVLAMQRAGPGWREGVPLGLYGGWLTAASGVAVSVVLTGYGVVDARMAALLMIVAVLAVALSISARRPDNWAYQAAVSWALFGIIVINVPDGEWLIVLVCMAGIAGLGALAWLQRNGRVGLP
ncbi:hypothetical protein GI374_16895 [Paracoccus sp. S-4012]|uniref:hypothetical protein n=1 Tax=Paracoccus sp. S-4012 TaxID=2665648 RepID=UPI0012AF380F|nr:hypothetical protein [Paracoccus sp. S-4012]MRX52057.1 hypothetical protein [Paracoccus sp. S-4012]